MLTHPFPRDKAVLDPNHQVTQNRQKMVSTENQGREASAVDHVSPDPNRKMLVEAEADRKAEVPQMQNERVDLEVVPGKV